MELILSDRCTYDKFYFVIYNSVISVASQIFSVHRALTRGEVLNFILSNRHQTNPVNDPVVINAMMFLGKIMHDSVEWVYFIKPQLFTAVLDFVMGKWKSDGIKNL